MKRIMLAISLLISISAVLINASTVSAQEEDTFQQVMNYLFLGDPHQRRGEGFLFINNWVNTKFERTVKIFNRKDCIAGYELVNHDIQPMDENSAEIVKVYWNNVDINSIEFEALYSGPVLKISGAKTVLLESLYDEFGDLIHTKSRTSYSIPIDGLQRGRLTKAIKLLFSKHCSGAKVQSAF